jgi:hypothetical protein
VIISVVKCVNSITYLKNYVTLVTLEMLNFVEEVVNMNTGNDNNTKNLLTENYGLFPQNALDLAGLKVLFK